MKKGRDSLMSHNKGRVFAVAAGATILALAGGVTGAVAGDFVNSREIKDGSVRSIDVKNGTLGMRDLNGYTQNQINQPGPAGPQGEPGQDGRDGKDGADSTVPGPQGPAGPAGAAGPAGKDGRDGLAGAIYRVQHYNNGGAGDATVACADTEAESMKYTAIAGGVEAGHTGANDFAVTASFPGRMDWSTGEPKEDRLDGWIILGNGEYTDNLSVWALCVPTTAIEVVERGLDN